MFFWHRLSGSSKALFLSIAIHLLVGGAVFLHFYHQPDAKPKSQDLPHRIDVRFAEAAPSKAPAKTVSKAEPSRSIPPKSLRQDSPLNESKAISESPVLQPFERENKGSLPRSVMHHYGDEFFDLSPAQQHYIIDNLQKIRRINDIVGNRLLRTHADEEIDPHDNNTVEFYLHPDGSISDLHLLNERSGFFLDELTLETIELAHTQYPKPAETTLIRIRVWILVK